MKKGSKFRNRSAERRGSFYRGIGDGGPRNRSGGGVGGGRRKRRKEQEQRDKKGKRAKRKRKKRKKRKKQIDWSSEEEDEDAKTFDDGPFSFERPSLDQFRYLVLCIALPYKVK